MSVVTYDSLLAGLLTDYENLDPDIDRSPGSLVYVRASSLASALWGLYRYQDRTAKQIFPDECTPEMLDRHANARGITRESGETDAALLSRLLTHMRHPPAGGNRYDFEAWALTVSYTHDEGLSTEWVESVKAAVCFPAAAGAGTVHVAITSDRDADHGTEEEAGSELVGAVEDYIETVRPLGCSEVGIFAATHEAVTVEMEVGLDAGTRDLIAADILGYIRSLEIGKTLYVSQLQAIAINRGAENPTVTLPAADVVPDAGPLAYSRCWANSTDITISA